MVALVATAALLIVPAGATAASPVLEFVVPGHSLPIPFTTESGTVNAEMVGVNKLVQCAASTGEGDITGPRSTVSKYTFTGCATGAEKCESTSASEGEIKTGPIDGELVYIDQAKRQVGIVLDPNGGTYIEFECEGIFAEGRGPFLAPVSPTDTEAAVFAAILSQSGSAQTPDQYETLTGEKIPAIPMGKHGSQALAKTGVEATFTVHPSWPGEIRAITSQEIEAQEEAQKRQEEALQTLETALKKQEEALKKTEEDAKQLAGEAKKHDEEVTGQLAATVKEYQEEAVATKKRLEATEKQLAAIEAKTPPRTRAQLLAKALRVCEKQLKQQRARCVASAHKKYGARK
ncbi:MAG TPA: hypothetical protein VK680_02630 [Solirubrobacteraceae bacterium]|jgi:hypothetical protein|nr:hypothetical protein [Solirubrobacteraceae bacterium]